MAMYDRRLAVRRRSDMAPDDGQTWPGQVEVSLVWVVASAAAAAAVLCIKNYVGNWYH